MSKLFKQFFFFSLLFVIFALGFSKISFARMRPPILPVSPPVLPTLSIPKLKITLPPIRTNPRPSPTITSKNKINWVAPYASLSADDFYIVADGKKFYGKTDDLRLNSDPPTPPTTDYTTFEAIWHENEREMRIFIYFYANSRTRSWWSSEFRTYDGQAYGDWIYYYGQFFTSRLGWPYIKYGNLDLNSNTSDFGFSGSVHFENLKLQSFFPYLTLR